MTIEVNNESGAAVDEAALMGLGRYLLDEMHINPQAELSVVLLDADAMAALHQQWMDVSGPTDVMAFPMDEADSPIDSGGTTEPPRSPSTDDSPGQALLGDVVLCPEVAAQQAAQAGHSVESELHLLCTHGILHLLGYDHGEPDEEREMFQLQARLLAGWTRATGRPPIRTPVAGTAGEARQ
jgi:probable rRNA maturation factor